MAIDLIACIGTRDCSQNCPYKVRRFNWFDYNYEQPLTSAQSLAHNPEVTVRSRGVMEKCLYCMQRITKSRIQAQIEGRRIADGEVRTACQEACPTQAILFGDLNDPEAQVNRRKDSPLNYDMLVELNTRPRTSYLAEVKNPNAALAARQGEPDSQQTRPPAGWCSTACRFQRIAPGLLVLVW